MFFLQISSARFCKKMFDLYEFQVEEPYDEKYQYCAHNLVNQPCKGDSGGGVMMQHLDHMYTVRNNTFRLHVCTVTHNKFRSHIKKITVFKFLIIFFIPKLVFINLFKEKSKLFKCVKSTNLITF